MASTPNALAPKRVSSVTRSRVRSVAAAVACHLALTPSENVRCAATTSLSGRVSSLSRRAWNPSSSARARAASPARIASHTRAFRSKYSRKSAGSGRHRSTSSGVRSLEP